MSKKPKVTKNFNSLAKLEVVYVPIASIGPNPYNPNRQSEHDFTLLCKSISADGFTQPVIVNKELMQIVDGEHRWRACKALNFDEVPVVFTDMTPEQMRLSTLRHNRARGSERSDLIVELFKELAELGATDFAVDELMLDPVELERLTALDGDELKGLDIQIDESTLGPNGKGLTEQDKAGHIDTTADERRAREAKLAEIKKAEEARMGGVDNTAYRLQLIFAGDPGQLVKRTLEALHHADDKEPTPAALLRLCRWAEENAA